MEKITIGIGGMMCGMCEAHICDVIRKSLPSAKKVKASRTKKEATFLSESKVDEEVIRKAIADTGYKVLSFSSEPYRKRGLFGR